MHGGVTSALFARTCCGLLLEIKEIYSCRSITTAVPRNSFETMLDHRNISVRIPHEIIFQEVERKVGLELLENVIDF